MEQQRETFLYKVESVTLSGQLFTIIVLADSDEKAFTYAENNLVRHTVAPPQLKEMSIVQKKPVGRGGVGYVIETAAF